MNCCRFLLLFCIALIVLIVGIVLCFLTSLGYNTYIKIKNSNKKIEVRVEKLQFS